jgi:hypothetical protein
MRTSNLLVDFLIIGATCIIWIVPLANIASTGQLIIDFSETDVLAFVGILYVLGLATNRLADDITTPWDRRVKREVFGESPFPSYHEQLNAAIARSETANEFLSYRRSVVRIARGGILNVLLGLILWVVMLFVSPGYLGWNTTLFLCIGLGILLLVLIRTWAVTLKGYLKAIKNFYILTAPEQSPFKK